MADKKDHEKLKRKIKISGFIVTGIGAVCCIIGFIDFFISMSGSGKPELFFLLFIGLPSLGIGAMLLSMGYRREITSYVKNESVPVINEAGQEIGPAVKAVTSYVKDGLKEAEEIVCECGAHNPKENSYCEKCGKPLFKICPSCGARQDADDVYCGKCGSKL